MISTESPTTIQTQESKVDTTQSKNQTNENLESPSSTNRKKSVKKKSKSN